MSEAFERYFDGKEINYGKACMMRDIEQHRLAGGELAALIDDLESKGMLLDKPFTPEPKEAWNGAYLSRLSKGHLADYFSRDYLEHCGEVAECIYSRTQRKKILRVIAIGGAIVLVAAAVIMLYRHFVPREKSESGLNVLPQEVETESMEEAAIYEAPGGIPARGRCTGRADGSCTGGLAENRIADSDITEVYHDGRDR